MQADTDFDYLNAQVKLLRDRVSVLEKKIDSPPKEREEGYYWVKHQSLDGWEPAKYQGCNHWRMLGYDTLIWSDELIEIGPRIYPPEE